MRWCRLNLCFSSVSLLFRLHLVLIVIRLLSFTLDNDLNALSLSLLSNTFAQQ